MWLLSAEGFQSCLIPLVFAGIGIFVSRLGRKDGDTSPMINHFAVGTPVLLMGLGTIVSEMVLSKMAVDGLELFQRSGTWLVIFLLVTIWSTDHDRYASWERDVEGNPTDSKKIANAIVLQNAVAVGSFVFYRYAVSL